MVDVAHQLIWYLFPKWHLKNFYPKVNIKAFWTFFPEFFIAVIISLKERAWIWNILSSDVTIVYLVFRVGKNPKPETSVSPLAVITHKFSLNLNFGLHT